MNAYRIDVERYLARIGYHGSRAVSRATLHDLHLAHASTITFENFDILLGRGIRIDLPSIEQKLIVDERGGYCFEQNLLLADVLEQLGFTVTRLLARVQFTATTQLPRTHMALKVDVDGVAYLADCGFGGWGLLIPLELRAGEQTQFGWRYRLQELADGWLLQGWISGWQDLYSFTLEPQYPVDYEPANWFVSTHPASPFVNMIIVQRPTPQVRHVLRNQEWSSHRPDQCETQTVDSVSLLPLLAQHFALRLPEGTRFPQLDAENTPRPA